MVSPRALATLALCLLGAGAVFDSPSLFVAGGALGGLALLLPGWAFMASVGARIERSELPAKVVEGEPLALSYRCRGGLLPARASLFDELVDEPLLVTTKMGWRTRMLSARGRAARRGRHRPLPPVLAFDDPLEIGSRRLAGERAGEILVLPAVSTVEAPGGGTGLSPEAMRRAAARANGGLGVESLEDPELDALGLYRPGTPASRIYWPSIARGAELMERRLTSAEGAGAVVVLDPTAAPPPQLDAAVRAAASLVVHLGADRGVELVVGGVPRAISIGARLSGWGAAHARLALVEAADGAPPAREIPDRGALFWVRAAASSPVAPKGGFLIEPARPEAGADEIAFTVAGCVARPLERLVTRARVGAEA
ncbi:MAG: DUF58 domain-containing protein [Solirubrobacterales bacterium]